MAMYFWIALGSAIGGVARFWASGWVAEHFGETFPWGTLIVNVTGSFLIGFFATLTPEIPASNFDPVDRASPIADNAVMSGEEPWSSSS
jgi:fluoride ion exporter CrcB/FEX